MVAEEFDKFSTGLNGRMDKLESNQHKTNQHLTSIDGTLAAIQNDIKKLYSMLGDIQKDTKHLRIQYKKLDQRIQNLKRFAVAVSQRTGTPFKI